MQQQGYYNPHPEFVKNSFFCNRPGGIRPLAA